MSILGILRRNSVYIGKLMKYVQDNPPTLDEIKKYRFDNQLNVDPYKFYKHFDEEKWVDANGNRVKCWKRKMRTWARFGTCKYAPQTKMALPKCRQCGQQVSATFMVYCNMPFCNLLCKRAYVGS